MRIVKSGEKPDVTISILNWNVREYLRKNLEALLALPDNISAEIFVIDNDSHDHSWQMVRRDFPQVKLIINGWNAGFARANNQAFRAAKGDVVLMLNPDMVVKPGAIEHTYKTLMADKTIGVMGIHLLTEKGETVGSVRRLPDMWSQAALLLKLPHLFPSLIDRYMAKDFDYTKTQDVDQVRGSFFAFRRELLETVGYLDEDFFIWFEEVDYCLRVKAAGMRVVYDASVDSIDLVGRSAAQVSHWWKQGIFGNSMARYFKKHNSWGEALLISLLRPIGRLAVVPADVRKMFRKKV